MFDIHQLLFSIRREFSRKDFLLMLGILVLFLLTRLVNLKNFPIFTDEGIYIHWAKIAWHDATWRFISLTDGKQPLQTWGTIPFLKLFPNDPLLAGRLFAVSTGLVALVGMFTLCWYAFGKKAGFIGALFYVLTPYFIFYDRLALADSAVNAGFIWILFFSILLAKKRNFDIALVFGLVAGFTLLAKSSARLFLALSALAPILLYEKSIKKSFWKATNYYILFGISAVLALLIYNIQRLSPFFHYVAQKNTTFLLTNAELMQDPFKLVFTNIYLIPTYLLWELGWLMGIFAMLGLYKLYQNDKKMFIYLVSWFVLPFIAIAFYAEVLFPRYIIFMATTIMIYAVYYFSQITKEKFFKFVLAGFVFTLLVLDYPLIFKAEAAFLPPVDRGQYVDGVTAVWGADEFMEFAREKSKEKKVLLVGEGNFGIIADVLHTLKKQDDNIDIEGYWPLNEEHILKYQTETKRKVYFVFPHRNTFPPEWPIKLVKKYSKPRSDEALYVFEYK